MRRYIFTALLLLMAGLALGCAGRLSGDDAEQIRALMDAQLAALNHSDITAYMATVDPESPVYRDTEKTVKDLVATCTTESKFVSFEIVKGSSREAQVRTVQETRRLDPGYQNKRITMVHLVRKESGGKWMFYGSNVEKSEDYE